jgi:hypothetical protein
MTIDDDSERRVLEILRKQVENQRGYAGFWHWHGDRRIPERDVARTVRRPLKIVGEVTSRNVGEDPPDCEATDVKGRRIAIEVTEFVDQKAIEARKLGYRGGPADWPRQKFTEALTAIIARKGSRYAKLKGGPYEGGYVIVVHTDEAMLPEEIVAGVLDGHTFNRPEGVSRVFLVLSYSQHRKCCPYFELKLR